jgi:hypothetical protein
MESVAGDVKTVRTKYCPLSFQGEGRNNGCCVKESCGWYDVEHAECAVLGISRAFCAGCLNF